MMTIESSAMLDCLRQFVQSHPTQKDAAATLGISQQFLSDMLLGRRHISDRIAKQLGYSKLSVYQQIES